MKDLLDTIKHNPVMITSFLSAIVLVAVNYGLLTEERASSITGVITTFLILLGGGAIARSQVVPLKKVVAYKDSKGDTVTPVNN
jgi:hypothetical protein